MSGARNEPPMTRKSPKTRQSYDLPRWRLTWRATFPDGRVGWYRNDGYRSRAKPTAAAARSVATAYTRPATVHYVTVRAHLGALNHEGKTYAIPARLGRKK